MTEYWVSQGNKWCDLCKIFISNNPSSIRNHDLGQRHKDNVSKRLTDMREQKVAKDKEKKEAERIFEQIEAKASRSYQKDVSKFKEARESNTNALAAQNDGEGPAKGSAMSGGDWEFESSSGYYYNQTNGCYYDPNSGFYYTDALGKWVTQEEALPSSQVSTNSVQGKPIFKKPSLGVESKTDDGISKIRAVSGSVNPAKSKAAPSSLTVKRKRPNEKPKSKVVSEEEAAALKAREAARKRVEEREKPLLGLYRK